MTRPPSAKSSKVEFTVLTDGRACDEGCGRSSVVELDGLHYCPVCLDRLARLGRIFADAVDEGDDCLRGLA